VVVDDGRRAGPHSLRRAHEGGDPSLLRVDREGVGPHELVEPGPQRQPVTETSSKRLEEVAVAVDEPRDHRPAGAVDAAGGGPIGEVLRRADRGDPLPVDGHGSGLEHPAFVVDGDDRTADEQHVAR
jgi:hypothetical protein